MPLPATQARLTVAHGWRFFVAHICRRFDGAGAEAYNASVQNLYDAPTPGDTMDVTRDHEDNVLFEFSTQNEVLIFRNAVAYFGQHAPRHHMIRCGLTRKSMREFAVRLTNIAAQAPRPNPAHLSAQDSKVATEAITYVVGNRVYYYPEYEKALLYQALADIATLRSAHQGTNAL